MGPPIASRLWSCKYRRSMKRLRAVEAVIESARGGRVHPVFSQTRTDHCRLVSVKPRLLESGSTQDIGPCLPDELRQFCPDTSISLGILAEVAADTVLRGDLRAAKSRRFGYLAPLNDGDHFQLLLSVVVGDSDDQMCRTFFLDRSDLAAIRHQFRVRYSSSFSCLEEFRKETSAKGFASAPGRRRYFEGLRSSNLERRVNAVNSAVRWLVRW